MALIWADSFDHYGSGDEGKANMLRGAWGVVNANVHLSTVEARTGNRSLRINQQVGLRSYARRVFPGAGRNTVGFAMGLFMPFLPGDTFGTPHGVFFRNPSRSEISFVYRSDGSIEIFRENLSQSLGSTDAGVLIAGAFVHLEFAFYLNSVTGWIEIRRDGVTVYRLEEANLGNNLITYVEIGGWGNNNFSFTSYYDDLIAWDGQDGAISGFVGPARVLTMTFPGDGIAQDWSKNGAATGHECVSEIPPDEDVTYIEGEGVGDAIEFTLPELPPEVVALAGVYFPVMGRLEDAGIGRIRMSLKNSGGNAEVGGEISMTPTYTYYGTAFQTNPDTGQTWTRNEFEAATLRVEKSL